MAFSFRVGTTWCHDFPKLARESGFYFNMHRSRVRVDWNRISNIDIDRVIRDRDFSTVDENVNNVIDYCLESEYDVKILDPSFVKLFRLAQLAVEYLLYCKQYLDHSVVILKDELRLKIEDSVKLKKEVVALEEVIKHLKEKSKERGRLLETKIGDCNGEIHKCPHCPKTFISAMFVNAHIARRHAYLSDLCLTSSPVHEHYRMETEKLHNEIKSLKERLNQTERVIRNESEKIPYNTGMDNKMQLNEKVIESFKSDINKSIEQKEHKGYQDEIINLKTMLFDEIHNLRQRDKTIYEHVSETNVQTLINQQEKEFQKLKNQLLERLTPDIESVHSKLHTQEDYWKSKIEHLELQHNKDVEKLAMELKLAQKAADNIKAEYESKVSSLERQSTNQSNILLEQTRVLQSLSREINESQNQGLKKLENNFRDRSERSETLEQETDLKQKYHADTKTEQIVVEDIESVSSVDSTRKLTTSISQNKLFQQDIHTLKNENERAISKDNKNMQQRSKKPVRSSNKMFEREQCTVKRIKSYDLTETSESQDSTQEKEVKPSIELTKNSLNDQLTTMKTLHIKESRVSRLKETLDKNEMQTPSTDVKSNRQVEELEDDLTSETKSDSGTLDSQTESESESLTTIRTSALVYENKKTSSVVPQSTQMKRQQAAYNKLEIDVQDMFERKLRELGIDPEWQGIPKATFKQKMDIIKHHHNITAKKLPKYHENKLKIIKALLEKISKRSKDTEKLKSKKKSPIDKVTGHDKLKSLDEFDSRQSIDDHLSISKIQDTTPKKPYPKPKSEHGRRNSNEDGNITNDSSALSKNEEEFNFKDYLESSQDKENRIKFSSILIKPQEDKKAIVHAHDSARKNSFESLFHNLQLTKTSTPNNGEFLTKSLESVNLDNSNTPQELQGFRSPKSSKSVLKSTTGSTSSIVKKKVLFDLTNDQDKKSFSEIDTKKDDLNDSDWNASSLSEDEDNILEDEGYKNTSNIVLKTSQSDKIAEISRKLEAQLSIVRQKPVGSVETIFASSYALNRENSIDKSQRVNSTNLSSMEHLDWRSALSSKTADNSFPQAAPRNLENKTSDNMHVQSISDDSDLNSDIDKILKLE